MLKFIMFLTLVFQIFYISATYALTYTYDPLGRVSRVVYDDQKAVDYTYDDAGNLLKIVPAAINGACGLDNGKTLTAAPATAYLCTAGTAGALSGSGPWTWSCAGTGTDSTSANCSAQIQTWKVTPSADANGIITPLAQQTVNHGAAATFTLTPSSNYTLVQPIGGTCPAGNTPTLASGTYTYTTGPITADCTVTAAFASAARPVVTEFTAPARSKSNSVTISMSATSGGSSTLNGYCVSESPDSAGCSWTTQPPTSYTFTATGDGQHTLYTWARNSSGLISDSKTASVVIDSTPPTLTMSTLASGSITRNQTLNIAGSIADASSFTLTVNTKPVTPYPDGSFSQAVTLATGSNTIVTKVTDAAGNATTDTRTITYDPIPPVITITAPADNSKTAQQTITLSGTLSETAQVTVSVNDGTPLPAQVTGTNFTVQLALSQGINTLLVTATDQALNSSSQKRSITFDGIKPSVAITAPAQDDTVHTDRLTISGTVSDLQGAATVVLLFNGQTYAPVVTNGSFSQQLTLPAENSYKIEVTATDEVGNSTTVSRTIIYSKLPDGACGSSDKTVTATTPKDNLCSSGTASTVTGSGPWAWSCSGTGTGVTASCSAPVKTWSVTPSTVSNGNINPSTLQTANNGATVIFYLTPSVAPSTTYTLVQPVGGTCPAGTYNSTTGAYTTGQITADCTVSAAFASSNRPRVSSFTIPARTKNATVPVTTFTTTVNPAVNGYCITQSSSPAGCAWNSTPPASYAITGADGTYILYAWAKDSSGLVSDGASQSITLDTTPPVITLSTLPDGAFTSNSVLNITGTVTDLTATTLNINSTPVEIAADGSFSYPLFLASGSNTFTLKATDSVGNVTTIGRSITLDTTLPEIVVSSPADNSITSQTTMNIIGTVNKTAQVSVTVNGHTPQSAMMNGNSFSSQALLFQGENTLLVTATDLAMNSSTLKRSVMLDYIKPALSITYPDHDSQIPTSILTLTGSVSSSQNPVTVRITYNGQTVTPAVTNGTFTQTLSFPSSGTYRIDVTGTDNAGNTTTVSRNIIYVVTSNGDVDGDGQVGFADALKVYQNVRGLVTLTADEKKRADVAPLDEITFKPKPDGKVEEADVMIIMRRSVGLYNW